MTGGHAELLDWVSDYWSHRLDRTRPLWDVVLVEGLEGGRWALANRTHHCMVDGVGSWDVGAAVLDATADAQDRPLLVPEQRDGSRGLVGALAHALDPRGLPDVLQRTRAAAEVLLRDEVVAAPRTSLNQPIGTLRRVETVSADLRDLKTVKSRLGGTVNDVALHATLAGTLFATRLFNVTITNVPGPAMPLYALGSQMREIYGLVPIAADHGLGVAILSYDGRVTFTIDADRTSVPDAHVFRAGIEESLGELLSLAKGAIPVTC